jgi:hypothetical protein
VFPAAAVAQHMISNAKDRLANFLVEGRCDSTVCPITVPVTGKVVVASSEQKIASIDLQLVRKEEVIVGGKSASDISEVQSIQVRSDVGHATNAWPCDALHGRRTHSGGGCARAATLVAAGCAQKPPRRNAVRACAVAYDLWRSQVIVVDPFRGSGETLETLRRDKVAPLTAASLTVHPKVWDSAARARGVDVGGGMPHTAQAARATGGIAAQRSAAQGDSSPG